MARKSVAPPERPRLLKAKAIAAELMQRQIAEGEEILSFVKSSRSPDAVYEKRILWSDYTNELLRSLFTTEEIPNEFNTMFGGWDRDPATFLRNETEGLQYRLRNLRSIVSRLELFDEAAGVASQATPERGHLNTALNRGVFVVHGRDEAVKQSVARFLGKLNLSPIILHEQPDKGRTIIQKFEDHADVGFAVVLLTPDDEGCLRGAGAHIPRARQNVILELGYFIGRLGRSRVCALKADGVEEPSDLHGVLYVPLDGAGAWQFRLAKELKAAEFDIDMNRVI